MKHTIKRILYYGRNHYCNVCCAHIREWINVGLDSEVFNKHKMTGAGRRKLGCPVCHSSDRDRLMLDFFQSNWIANGELRNQEVLHIAPEKYLTPSLQKKVGRYVKGDAFEPGYQYDEQTQHLDIQSLPFQNESFDGVIANHVLEHVCDDEKALSEIMRVLKPNGWAVLQVPMALDLAVTIEVDATLSTEERITKTGQFDHLRLYGIDFWKKLEKMGFVLKLWNSQHDAFKWGLNPNEKIIAVQKK